MERGPKPVGLHLTKSMTAEGYICWLPACNPSDTKVSPNNFGADLTQFTNGKQSNGNHTSQQWRRTKSTRTEMVITTRMDMERKIIVITRRNLGMEGATRTLGKLGHLSRRNLMNELDRLLYISTQEVNQ